MATRRSRSRRSRSRRSRSRSRSHSRKVYCVKTKDGRRLFFRLGKKGMVSPIKKYRRRRCRSKM